ncbi:MULTISPECIES: type II restriction endonuclease [Salinivibrio]|uniref:type II restriction endonuclease n=1 Tax=Salinivibrio TaxID=51366 RepID=UPI00084C0D1F|nr:MULTISPECIES: type II restriction endonuclease [Salinivibrio]ODP99888.1 hypothetical protein BGK46_09250 [Salinivibrio sp. DV]OOF27172.1 hypothetical protein BZJ19_02750 [Salinivibrio proteolyticus]
MFEQLSDVFTHAAFKYLSNVDADPKASNQHEIGGLPKAGIGEHLGMPDDGTQLSIPATFVYLDDDDSPLIYDDNVTWYDSRYTDPKRGAEWRLYYKSNDITSRFQPGDFMMITLTHERTLLIIFCPPDSEQETQIRAIFGAQTTDAAKTGLKKVQIDSRLAVPIRLIFARYGIEIGHTRADLLDEILERFGNTFPKTREFSQFARDHAQDVSPVETPDKALIDWMELEESAFRQLERHIVRERLKEGFGEHGDDVDLFVSFSLSVQNRRKSRSGHAFENHIEHILTANQLTFERGALTEGRQKPDFLFPGSAAYQDLSFPADKLRILGAKTTCKDRWRQVLAEGARIPKKHLITMEHAITEAQTSQMRDQNLQLVVPEAFHKTYTQAQASWLMTLRDFIDEVRQLG